MQPFKSHNRRHHFSIRRHCRHVSSNRVRPPSVVHDICPIAQRNGYRSVRTSRCRTMSSINIVLIQRQRIDQASHLPKQRCDSSPKTMHSGSVHFSVRIASNFTFANLPRNKMKRYLIPSLIKTRFIRGVVATAQIRAQVPCARLQSTFGCIRLLLHQSNHNTGIHIFL